MATPGVRNYSIYVFDACTCFYFFKSKKIAIWCKPPFQEKNTKFSNEFRAIFTAKVLELVQRICPKLEV